MLYLSTRNNKIEKTASQAVLEGLASDGGLYMPKSFAGVEFPMENLAKMGPKEISATVVSLLFAGDEMLKGAGSEYEEAYKLVSKAYDGKFENEDYAPLSKVNDAYVMELYHGPTCAFKDVALQLLPQFIGAAKRATGMEDEIVILTATSGDTGSAALSGFSNVDGVKIIVFYPKKGISAVQERQMVSVDGKNTCVCSVVGNFDDAQSGVKNIFAKLELPKGVQLSSANSINIGRLVPQIAYYFKAYGELLNKNEIKMGDKVNYVVPTGNFGDILAGYFAKKMGLPVGKLVCSSNTNKVLTDFFESGVYNKNRSFYITKSPSMDILISSNLERLLYLTCGDAKCAEYMAQLKEKGEYKLAKDELDKIRQEFDAGFCDDIETIGTIEKVYNEYGYLMDTHTAVAWNVYEKWAEETGNKDKTVVLSTASPYKFSNSVMKALGKSYNGEFDALKKLQEYTGAPVPNSLVNIENKAVFHNVTVEKDDMLDFVSEMVNKKIWHN
ncbi:MAG: threonine synthase [Ruminococcaceae bacterium]|nr:threonine synthase [Oscillospiraceae bacterium]